MDCNRDEAIRVKTVAEKKLADKDYVGAKKFTLKAQTLYPELDGISQMLTILDVHISAQNKVNGELDLYGILGVNPSDDDETIRKQYRKLALILHPDKNKSVGADDAFKFISEAWSLLSDKAKRLAYNQKRNFRVSHLKIPSQSWAPSAAPEVNSSHNFANRTTSKSKSKARLTTTTTRMGPTSVFPLIPPRAPDPPSNLRQADTFWTICNRCKMHYEYLKVYLNQTLLCPNCHEPFLANETVPPINVAESACQHHHDSSNHAPTSKPVRNEYNTNSFWGSLSGTDACKTDPSIASKAANVVQRVNERFRREREELNARWPSKNRKVDGSEQHLVINDCGLRTTGFETNGVYGFCSMNSKLNSTRELTLLETRNMLMKKAQKEICRKINEWLFTGSPANNVNGNQEPAMSVPDPDFHNFDLDRTENSFQDNQVWAAYDDDDGMPRFYALIHKVLSRNPLKMKISWLNSKTTTEFDHIDWIGSGFSKTCGEFRIGKFQINTSLNSFSQKVEWIKTPRGSVLIYPRKGEVWALYRNWSRDWTESIQDNVIHQYEMVQVLDDYNEEQGVPVSPLVKFSEFRTVFRPLTDHYEVKKIPKEEMFRFSHQVPKYLLTGKEAHNSPKGCLELDPAAFSLELIQTTS